MSRLYLVHFRAGAKLAGRRAPSRPRDDPGGLSVASGSLTTQLSPPTPPTQQLMPRTRHQGSLQHRSMEQPRSSSSPAGSSHPANDEPVTLSDFLRSHDYAAQPADFERRQRRRIDEAEAPPRYRRPSPPSPTTFPGATFLDRPPANGQTPNMSNPPSNGPSAPQISPMRNGTLRERGSLEPLPRWQPDHEVSACPVCKTSFSFFFRKHHCRKCGRVVCNNCSPHRITIPRQYVVQPPSTDDSEVSEAYPARNLGGGEVVRVCNPCVPDPWTPEGASQPRSREISIGGGSQESDTTRIRQRYQSSIGGSHTPLPPPSGRMRAQSHQPVPNFSRSLPPSGPSNPPPSSFGSRPNYDSAASPSSSSSRPRHRYTQSSVPAPPAYSTYDPRVRPLSAAVPSPSSQQHPPAYRRPRREVREEDECPVCGEELPPGDEIRQQHIEECISTRFGTPSQSSSSLPQPPTSFPPTSTPPPPGTGTRPRAPTYRPRGMAIYRATEKDCLDAAGEAQECVICFEEFQPGDELGRMECLCKFHRACIRRWWEMRGAGSCPTHMVHVE